MVIHIGKGNQPQQPVQQQQPAYQQPQVQYQPQQMPPIQQAQPVDNKIKELEEQNKTLENINYFNGLADEKTFRFELIQSINRIALLLNSLNEKITELASGEEEEVKNE